VIAHRRLAETQFAGELGDIEVVLAVWGGGQEGKETEAIDVAYRPELPSELIRVGCHGSEDRCKTCTMY
jgi:hypothetical protein